MWKLISIVNRNLIYKYSFFYFLGKIGVYSLIPLYSKYFLDAVSDKNKNYMLLYGIINVFLLIISQLVDFIIDIFYGKLSTESLINFCNKTSELIEFYDLKKHDLKDVDLHLHLNQNYEIVKNFIFYNPLQIVFLSAKLLTIFLIMFSLSKVLSLGIIMFIPLFLFINIKLGSKISDISEQTFNSLKIIKKYISDKYLLTKEERLLKKKQLEPIESFLLELKKLMTQKYKSEAIFDNFFTYGILNWVICLVTLISGYLVFTNKITIGTLFAFQIYVSSFWGICEKFISIRKEYLISYPIITQTSEFFKMELQKYNNNTIETIELKNYQSLDSKNKGLHSKINICFHKKNIYIFTGKNGCGKTTLIEAILGYTNRFVGKIKINEQEINSSDIVYISSNPFISNFTNNLKKEASYGQNKMKQILLSLETNKTVYLFDEPTNFLDKDYKQMVLDLILSLNKSKKIIIIISHDKEFISQIMILNPNTQIIPLKI